MKLVTQVFFTDYKYFTLFMKMSFLNKKLNQNEKILQTPGLQKG